MLNSEISCREFLTSQSVSTIASQIRHDQDLCKAHRLPSLLVLYLPKPSSEEFLEIANELCPETRQYGVAIVRAQFGGIVQGIKTYLSQMNQFTRHESLPSVEVEHSGPSKEEVETTLKVLSHCIQTQNLGPINFTTPLETVLRHLSLHLEHPSSSPSIPQTPSISSPQESYTNHKSTPRPKHDRKCYICHFHLLTHHPLYPSLCPPCGSFNLSSSSISLPSHLKLQNRTALVTGARINLGFHTALRLLRCGGKVIVTSRYPRDAEVRYRAERDFGEWEGRLVVIGADFRAASDVFKLVAGVKDVLRGWCGDGEERLDILINNAAQTLTDPVEKEWGAVQRELSLGVEYDVIRGGRKSLLWGESGYVARVRAGAESERLSDSAASAARKLQLEDRPGVVGDGAQVVRTNTLGLASMALMKRPEKSSWMQTISQVPYEDIVSAHSVNTFVPLILTRELLPLMGQLRCTTSSPSLSPSPSSSGSPQPQTQPNPNTPSIPLGYIINVSSREGIFESSPTSSSKNGHHVHTNLTKAALNMLTETEAGPAWRERRVAINSVDPGYMSAAPEIEERWKSEGNGKGRECPIGWEDGAGRVLWVVGMGWGDGGGEVKGGDKAIWGRFLKHFGRVEVDPGIGR